jgi:Dolichyl-phosphate-mannose-protein mannosyltransferase
MARGTWREARTQGAPICGHIGATEDTASRHVTPARRPGRLPGQAPSLLLAAALGAILALAAGLRLTGIRYGLPYPLLNPDEASIVPRAWEMVHGGGLDPGWYDYPSLLMELLAPFQAFAGEPSYLAARLVAVVLGLAGVAGAAWLGRSAYDWNGALAAAAATALATTHVAYSRMAVTDVALTLGITCALALALSGRLEWAGVAVGLAASAKYPGALAFVPVVAAGWGSWRRLVTAAGLAVAVFVLTSPFVVVHAGRAWDDVSRVQRLARAGWLGFEGDPPTPLAFADRLWEALGPAVLVALVGIAVALARRTRADLVLGLFAAVWAVQLLPIEAHFDRYVLPLIPVLGAFAGRLPSLLPAAAVALVLPLAWSIGDAADLTRTDTRVAAAAWIEQNVASGATVAADPSSPDLPRLDVTRLELPGPGRPQDPERDVARLRRDGIRYALVNGAVADRVLAAANRYPREARFYAELETGARRVLIVRPGGDLGGPWVALYELDG